MVLPHSSSTTHKLIASALLVGLLCCGCFSSVKMEHAPLDMPRKIGGKVAVVADPSLDDAEARCSMTSWRIETKSSACSVACQ